LLVFFLNNYKFKLREVCFALKKQNKTKQKAVLSFANLISFEERDGSYLARVKFIP